MTTTAERQWYEMKPVPGLMKAKRETARNEFYRTWADSGSGMGAGWECLRCCEWGSSYATPAEAEAAAIVHRDHVCHVTLGCECFRPHLTAASAARLGIKGDYPQELGPVFMRMAGQPDKRRAPRAHHRPLK